VQAYITTLFSAYMFEEKLTMIDRWQKLKNASPELASSCEEMMLELDWYAESLRKAGDDSHLAISELVKRAKDALKKAGIKICKEY
jgi:hypothetical protein